MDIQVARDIIGAIPLLNSVERVEFLDEGFSPDVKYVLWEDGSPRYVLRIGGIDLAERRRRDFDLMAQHSQRGILCSKPYTFGVDEDNQVCYWVLGYVPGKNAEEALPPLTQQHQFDLGLVAGEQLRKLHEMAYPKPGFDWPTHRVAKHFRYVKAAQELALTFDRQDVVERFIKDALPILNDVPVRFQHDDYHPGNLIIDDGRFSGMIDFHNSDWGDPIEDFYKVPWFTCEVSVPFANGQFAGYFGEDVPDRFWLRYNLYVAMSLTSSLVWGYRTGQLSNFSERLPGVLDTHDFIKADPPTWYSDTL